MAWLQFVISCQESMKGQSVSERAVLLNTISSFLDLSTSQYPGPLWHKHQRRKEINQQYYNLWTTLLCLDDSSGSSHVSRLTYCGIGFKHSTGTWPPKSHQRQNLFRLPITLNVARCCRVPVHHECSTQRQNEKKDIENEIAKQTPAAPVQLYLCWWAGKCIWQGVNKRKTPAVDNPSLMCLPHRLYSVMTAFAFLIHFSQSRWLLWKNKSALKPTAQ